MIRSDLGKRQSSVQNKGLRKKRERDSLAKRIRADTIEEINKFEDRRQGRMAESRGSQSSMHMFSNGQAEDGKQSRLVGGEVGDKLVTEKGEYPRSENYNGPFGVSNDNRIKFDKSKFQTLGTDNGQVFQQN